MAGVKRTFKAKKKLSGGRAAYRPWKEWEVGDYIIGVFKGTKTDNYDKDNYLIEVEDVGGPSKALKKLIGQTLGLNETGQLKKAMAKVEEGEIVQVMYNGMAEIEGGKYKGKEAHSIEVDLMSAEGEDEDEETDDLDDEESEEDDL